MKKARTRPVGYARCLECRSKLADCGCRVSKKELRVYKGVDPVTHKKRWQSVTFTGTKTATREQLKALNNQALKERAGAPTSYTLGYAITEWLDKTFARQVRAGKLSAQTLHGYRGKANRRIIPAIGDIPLAKLTARDLDSFYEQMEAEGLAPSTIHQMHNVITGALKQARKWGWVDRNVADEASPPGVPKPDVSVPTTDEVGRLIAAAETYGRNGEPNLDLLALILVSASTGARRGEMCALRWRNVRLDESPPFMLIEKAVADLPGLVTVKDTKTHAARPISLDPFAAAILDAHRRRVEAACGGPVAADAFVFSQDLGASPYRPGRVTAWFRRVREKAGLSHVKLHGIRHWAATTMIADGVDPRTVASRLGHSRPSTTLNVYAHYVQAADQAAAVVLGSALAATKRLPEG